MNLEEKNEQDTLAFARKLLAVYLEDQNLEELSRHLRDYRNLRTELSMRERQLANLTKNIPGGAHQCANDPDMTLLSMSDGFLSMFGYTKEEVEELFDGKFVNMVYPGDRADMLKSTYAQLEAGPNLELEYRVLCKNGQPIWVLDKGRLIDDGSGGQCFYCLLIDVTQRKQQEEELRLSLERHKIISDQATDIIFEWDIRKDTLKFSPNWKKRFDYEAISRGISGQIPLSSNIHPEDMPAFVKIMQDTAAGIPYSETEFRIRSMTGRYYWCRIRATTQYDADGRPLKAVGVIVDIDEEKRQRQALIMKTQYDALTGIYNKATIDLLVERRMKSGSIAKDEDRGYHALLIIDVDHFKGVNDQYGHLCGDFVLSEVAAALKSSIRSSDLAGRVGGDEFLVYLPEVTDTQSVCHTAERILGALGSIRPEPEAPPITCSIGIAVLPQARTCYQELYQAADNALYQRKDGGRNGFTLFNPEAEDR
ncbi:GGDEF domain-containing protein [Gordonibacter sp.]|uniref:GGDEF domain-containing protein n=1 Tax=Gordonibacter sp. TaxID=1968902 RepID=UPI002FC8C5BB